MMYVCDNCGRRYERQEDFKHVFPRIPDLLQRLDPGGTVPAGECPECGALVYLETEPVRVLVLLDGGLVQGVVADRPDIEVAVLTQDLDGVEEDELVEITGDVHTLRGTLEAHEVTVAPTLIESAWETE
jgi:DNA-directed RNA polymerase subunit RPC12/RpoP